MSKVSREKIALVVFVVLIAASLFGLIGYLAVGHSWNVAASNIDDATGRMDGYTAIVFEGTVDPALAKKETESSSDSKTPDASLPKRDVAGTGQGTGPGASGSSAGSAADDKASGKAVEDDDAAFDTEKESGTGKEFSSEDDEVGSASRGSGTSGGSETSGGAGATSGGSGAAGGSGTPGAATGSGSSDAAESGSAASSTTKKKVLVDLAEVEESYLEKNATVFELNTHNLGAYSEGTILRKGDHRFGVFSVTQHTTARMIAAQVAYFKEHEVDFIVVLTPEKEIVEEAEGIDIVISTQDEGLFVMGETINGTFYVNAPELGSAGVILISPSNVVSAKVVQAS